MNATKPSSNTKELYPNAARFPGSASPRSFFVAPKMARRIWSTFAHTDYRATPDSPGSMLNRLFCASRCALKLRAASATP